MPVLFAQEPEPRPKAKDIFKQVVPPLIGSLLALPLLWAVIMLCLNGFSGEGWVIIPPKPASTESQVGYPEPPPVSSLTANQKADLLKVGMSENAVQDILGQPERTTQDIYAGEASDQWYYNRGGLQVVFTNGVLSSIHTY